MAGKPWHVQRVCLLWRDLSGSTDSTKGLWSKMWKCNTKLNKQIILPKTIKGSSLCVGYLLCQDKMQQKKICAMIIKEKGI